MRKTIFTSLSPNVESDDIRLNLGLLFKPYRWKKGKSVSKLENEFSKYTGFKHSISTISGRTGLLNILQSLSLKPGNEVLLQAYTCVAVPSPITWVGAKPIYVDIDKDTLNMSAHDLEKKITKNSKVLIIQHTFGFPADLEKLLTIAKNHNLFVIEDCAHSLGAKYNGKLVGSFGNASFFSFGRSKIISSIFGGMITTNDDKLALKIRNTQNKYPHPSFFWIKRQLLHPVLTSFVKKTYDFFSLGKLILYVIKKLHILSLESHIGEREGSKSDLVEKRFPNALAILALHQFKKLNRFNTSRQITAIKYQKALPDIKFQKALPDTNPIYLRYFINHPKAEEIIAEAKKRKIFLGNWYTTPIAPNNVKYKNVSYKGAKNADSTSLSTLNLPTDIHITNKDIKRITSLINEY